jgi:hypothetical protein
MANFRIRIDDREDRTRGVHELSKRVRVVCLRRNEFVIPDSAVLMLKELGVKYTVVGEEVSTNEVRSIRDSATTFP